MSRPVYSCIRCAARKVKCDRQNPCNACLKHGADCVFQPSPATEKPSKRVKRQVLANRIRHYEGLLHAHGIDPSKLSDTSDKEASSKIAQTNPMTLTESMVHTMPITSKKPQSSSTEFMPSRDADVTQVVHRQGRSAFVEK
jgi:Fungal Zn(2)-Cys(6) binuclear cluster domain